MPREKKILHVEVPAREPKRFVKRNIGGKWKWIFDFRGIPDKKRKIDNDRRFSGNIIALESPKKCQQMIDAYFKSCYGPLIDNKTHMPVYDKHGDMIMVQTTPFTVSGLAYSLGLATQTLLRYANGDFDDLVEEDNQEWFSTLLYRAKQKVEGYAESRLYDKDGSFGAKFVLDAKFGWKTQKDQADIRKMDFDQWKAIKEMEIKQQLASMGEDDSNIEIHIIRKGDDE